MSEHKKRLRRSRCWLFFDKLDQYEAMCRLCSKTLKSCGNTSNLRSHIRQNHPSALDIMNSETQEEEAVSVLIKQLKGTNSDDEQIYEDQSYIKTDKVYKSRSPVKRQQQYRNDREDVYDLLGRHVAIEMRNLSCDSLRRKMKRKLQELIIEINLEEEEQLRGLSREMMPEVVEHQEADMSQEVQEVTAGGSEQDMKLFHVQVIESELQ